MTPVEETLRPWLPALRERPGDFALLAAVADDLEERAGTVPCGRCKGEKGWVNPVGRYVEFSGASPCWEDCPACAGSGVVSDGRRERAELIRVQVELAGLLSNHDHTGVNGFCSCGMCGTWNELWRREREILHSVRRSSFPDTNGILADGPGWVDQFGHEDQWVVFATADAARLALGQTLYEGGTKCSI